MPSVYRCKLHGFVVVDRCLNVSTSPDLRSFRVLAVQHAPSLSRTSIIFTTALNTMQLESDLTSSNKLSTTLPPSSDMKPSAIEQLSTTTTTAPSTENSTYSWIECFEQAFNNYYTTFGQVFNDNSTTHSPIQNHLPAQHWAAFFSSTFSSSWIAYDLGWRANTFWRADVRDLTRYIIFHSFSHTLELTISLETFNLSHSIMKKCAGNW